MHNDRASSKLPEAVNWTICNGIANYLPSDLTHRRRPLNRKIKSNGFKDIQIHQLNNRMKTRYYKLKKKISSDSQISCAIESRNTRIPIISIICNTWAPRGTGKRPWTELSSARITQLLLWRTCRTFRRTTVCINGYGSRRDRIYKNVNDRNIHQCRTFSIIYER